MKFKPLWIFLVVFSVMLTSLMGTVYVPVSAYRQMKESEAVVQGIYNSKTYKKLSNGKVVTELSFKIVKAVGIPRKDIINKNEFKIIMSGGYWGGLKYHIPGSPVFTKGEEIIALLNRVDRAYWLHNLALGSYRIKRVAGEKRVISYVFPNNKKIGSLGYDEFLREIVKAYSVELAHLPLETEILIGSKNPYNKMGSVVKARGRKIASLDENVKEESEENTIIWPILLLGFLGAIFRWLSRRNEAG